MLAQDHRSAEAVTLEQESLAMHMRVSGEQDLSTINAMLNLGEFQRDLGRNEEAEATLRRALGLENRWLGPNQPETAATKYDLATLLLRKGEGGDALALLRESVDHGLPPRLASGIKTDPLLSALHQDPRFEELVGHVQKVLTGSRHSDPNAR